MDMLKFDAQKYDYPSRRSVVYGKKGMVCTSQPLAAQAGLDIIKRGGNAVDAAIATAACMTVLEPTSNGIGSDAFALVWTKGELHGLNASGRSPMAITAEEVKKTGIHRNAETRLDPGDGPGRPVRMGGTLGKVWKTSAGKGAGTGDHICTRGISGESGDIKNMEHCIQRVFRNADGRMFPVMV